MATAFPGGVDSFPDPVGTDLLDNAVALLKHATQHTNVNDAINAIEIQLNLAGLLTGSGVPGAGLGVDTNLYLNTATGIIYRKTAGTWAAIYTPSGGGGGGTWTPTDQGLVAWNYDPALATNGSGTPSMSTGVMYIQALDTSAATVTKIYMSCVNGGTALVNGFCALYNAAGTLLQTSNNQATALNAGLQLVTFTIPSQAVAAGKVYVGFWCSGSSAPTFAKTGNLGAAFGPNTAMSSPFRFSSVSSGLTTTAPATLGSPSAGFVTNWVGLAA